MNLFKRSLVVCSCLLVLSHNLQAQNALSTQVEKQIAVQQATSYELFSVSTERTAAIDAGIRDVTYLTLNREAMAKLMQEKSGLISFTIPGGSKTFTVQLLQYDFHTRDYRVVVQDVSGYKPAENIEGLYYRGALKGDEPSVAAFSFYPDEVGAVFSDRENGNYNLILNKANPGADHQNYILYRERDIIDHSQRGTCALTEDMDAMIGPGTEPKTSEAGVFTTCKTVRISIFADYLLYQRCTSDVVKSVQYVNTLFNVVSALYANDNMPLNLSETIVSKVSEGYTYSSSNEVLAHFGNRVQGYTYSGDIAHFMTGYYHPTKKYPTLGGLAWRDVMCMPASPYKLDDSDTYVGPYSMGNVYVSSTIPSLPTYSWDVEVTAHELGHNVGSPHTQHCSWPGGAIDGCVDPEGGSCAKGPKPTSGGTVMSYCHLDASIGINFANGFGPLPTALLKSRIEGASCLGSGLSDSTLKVASKTIIANEECYDGLWTHYFNNNNTSDLSDDIMILSVKKGGQDIGNVSDPAFLIKMITNSYYAKDTVPDVIAPYADTNWHEINRRWTIQLPAGKQPKLAVTARYLYMPQDVKDISKVLAGTTTDTTLVLLKYANSNPVTSLPTAVKADMRILSSGTTSSTTKWRTGSTGSYRYAEVVLDSGMYGGTLGYQYQLKDTTTKDTTSAIHEHALTQKVNIHPNPANHTISVTLNAAQQGNYEVAVYDNLGRMVYRQMVPQAKENLSIDVSSLSPGVYTLRCVEGQNTRVLSGLFVKQ